MGDLESDLHQLQQKLQDAVDKMMNKIEVERIRPVTKETYQRIAKCYDTKTASSREVEACAQGNFGPMQHIQNNIQHEMNDFQNRLQRCGMSCQDEVKDKFLNATRSPESDAAANKVLYKCMSQCVEKQLSSLKNIQTKLERDIDQVRFN